MCDIVEEYAEKRAKEATKECAAQERKNVIKKMLNRGDTIEEILEIYPEMDESAIWDIKKEI